MMISIYKRIITLLLILSISIGVISAQGYIFTDVVRNAATPVKNQANSGTCWSYATAAFLESELLRIGKGEFNLSEMFVVRHNYINRLNDNFLRRGKGNLGQGSLAHMFINIVDKHGIVPFDIYNGINYDSNLNNHRELNKYLNSIAEASVSLKAQSPEYHKLIESLLDIYLGPIPNEFTYKGKKYTPKTFLNQLGLKMDDYVQFTSFTHHPFYSQVLLEVPDNWDHARFYNLPLDELMMLIDNALLNGYTIAWDGDVSESGFSHTHGIAINPYIPKKGEDFGEDRARFESLPKDYSLDQVLKFEQIYPEIVVNQEIRQNGYESFVTTDDHLMLLTGIVKDQNGTQYYITKNSWGTDRNRFGGYLNMSESYVRAKTISVMVHKDAVPKIIKDKIGL